MHWPTVPSCGLQVALQAIYLNDIHCSLDFFFSQNLNPFWCNLAVNIIALVVTDSPDSCLKDNQCITCHLSINPYKCFGLFV